MRKGLTWRLGLSLSVIVAALYLLSSDIYHYLAPKAENASQTANNQAPSFLPDNRINLGLDLKGGIHLTLGVEVNVALQNALGILGQDLMAEANKLGLLMTTPKLSADGHLDFVFTLPEKKAAFDELLAKKFPQLAVQDVKEVQNKRLRFLLALTSKESARLHELALDQALKTIRNRIDQFGVAEPDIRKQQDGRIVIQLPGMDDMERAVSIIGKTAHLEFRLVKDGVDISRPAPFGVEYLPFNTEKEGGPADAKIAVDAIPVLTGEHITNATPLFQQDGEPFVSISFDKRGSDIFARVTGENLNKRLAIVLDGVVYSAPAIRAKIEGDASVTGNFTPAEATDLALVLRAGSLPAPVTVLEERSVGPSLGQESIDMGVTAALIGGGVVMLFMAIYYSGSGLIANFMLVLDVMLVLAGMSLFGATLTLPGIAGIVLTLGMAVDANVLVFERIREEIQNGEDSLVSVDRGFSKAMLAIVDSNLTTIIAAVILYQFGTGPIRGFAVTLTLGILASMFTAIFVSRIIFDMWINSPNRKISI